MAEIQRFIASVLVTLALIGGAGAAPAPGFIIQGRVYCDACRAGFETDASQNLAGAKVKVECRHFGKDEVVHKAEAVTDASGWYKVDINEDHQEDICEVVLVHSPVPDCAEIENFRDRSRVPLTHNNGIKQSGVRFANPIAFFRKEPLKTCGVLLHKYALADDSAENP